MNTNKQNNKAQQKLVGTGLFVIAVLEQKQLAAGGGWNSPVYLTQINSIQSYENTSPTVGFRVFMEVIEK